MTSYYAKDLRAKDRLQSQCRPCQRDRERANYHKYAKVRRERQKKFWAALPKAERVRRQRQYSLVAEHGCNLAHFNKMLKRQKGVCALCKKEPSGKRTKVLQVDHDHKTGKIRGLLCNECNTALGRLGDNIKGLMRAINYLKKSI